MLNHECFAIPSYAIKLNLSFNSRVAMETAVQAEIQ